MKHKFLDIDIDRDGFELPESAKIEHCLLESNKREILNSLDFLGSEEKFLYLHGFIGTGKRQIINYLCEFLNSDVIKLEYFCKESTSCDDLLLKFNDVIEKHPTYKAVNINTKITTLSNKFKQQITSIKKPFLIILHFFDNVPAESAEIISDTFSDIIREDNVKIIATSRALKQNILNNIEEDKNIFLKALSKGIVTTYLKELLPNATDKHIEDLYGITRGYYFYIALSVKLIQAMNITPSEFAQKVKQSGQSLDSYLGNTYINIIPQSVRNFYWFLRTIRHGISLNALALLEIYDEFAINYLKTNLIVYQANDYLYLHDYFAQKVDIVIPTQTEIKLNKYIIGIYEQQLKEPLKNRAIFLSRQTLRAEIDYHSKYIDVLEDKVNPPMNKIETPISADKTEVTKKKDDEFTLIEKAKNLKNNKKYTEAIEIYQKVMENYTINLQTLVNVRLELAKLYKTIEDYSSAQHYYELVETYYQKSQEMINLNYLYYDLTDLYQKMYKIERAIETAKKVIYSVDTPQSLNVNACTLLGNIYLDNHNPEEAIIYFNKALESVSTEVDKLTLAELYFKTGLAYDDNDNQELAFDYYNKCITIVSKNPYLSAAYSNIASCYMDSGNYEEALNYFQKSYLIEKKDNNFDGIYYTSSNIAMLIKKLHKNNAFEYLKDAKSSAEYLDDPFYIIESSIAMGDYYYNLQNKQKESLNEYFHALKIAKSTEEEDNILKIQERIDDMKLRLSEDDFAEVEKTYVQ